MVEDGMATRSDDSGGPYPPGSPLVLSESLTYGRAHVSAWVAQGLIVLILVLFLLAESDMLTPKVIRFFAGTPGDAAASEQTLKDLTRQIRSFLLARTLINLALGLV